MAFTHLQSMIELCVHSGFSSFHSLFKYAHLEKPDLTEPLIYLFIYLFAVLDLNSGPHAY
jgi:hypothetical protein